MLCIKPRPIVDIFRSVISNRDCVTTLIGDSDVDRSATAAAADHDQREATSKNRARLAGIDTALGDGGDLPETSHDRASPRRLVLGRDRALAGQRERCALTSVCRILQRTSARD